MARLQTQIQSIPTCSRSLPYTRKFTGTPVSDADADILCRLQSETLEAYTELEKTRRDRMERRESVYDVGMDIIEAHTPLSPSANRVNIAERNAERWAFYFRQIIRGTDSELSDDINFDGTMVFEQDTVKFTADGDQTVATLELNDATADIQFDDPVSEFHPREDGESVYVAVNTDSNEVGLHTVGPRNPTVEWESIPDPSEDIQRLVRALRTAGGHEARLSGLDESLATHFIPRDAVSFILLLMDERRAVSVDADPERHLLVEALAETFDLHLEYVKGLNAVVLTKDADLARFAESIGEDSELHSMVYEYALGSLLGYPQEAVEFFTFEDNKQHPPLTAKLMEQGAYMTLAGDLTDRERLHIELMPFSPPQTEDMVQSALDIGRRFEQALKQFDSENDVSIGQDALERFHAKKFES